MCRKYSIQEQQIMASVKSSRKHVCEYCRKQITNKNELTLDHIKPFSRGGLTTESNLVIACKSCNTDKSDMTKEEYIKYIELTDIVTKNSMANTQLKEAERSYENLIKGFEEITKRRDSLLREKKELELIMKNAKVNAAEGYMLFDSFRKLLQKISETEIERKGLEGSNGFALEQFKQVRSTLKTLSKSIMIPIRNELGIGTLADKETSIINEIEKYILKYSKINKEIA